MKRVLIDKTVAADFRAAVAFERCAWQGSSEPPVRPASHARVRWRGRMTRRGVASVLAMMFLVIFSSLAAAMAVVAQSNLRTAASGLRLSRAMSAAETGLVFARRRLATESARLVVEKGVIDGDYGEQLWQGTYGSGDGTVTLLQPAGYTTGPGIAHAVRDAHLADGHNIVVLPGDSTLPEIDQYGTLRTRPIALTDDDNGAYFRLTYEVVDPQVTGDESFIRVTSEGFDQDISRRLQMDFKIEKKIEFAILSPNRIMIGKNVLIEGPLGSRYGLVAGELDSTNGDPLVMRSDFYYLDDDLNDNLDVLFAQIKANHPDSYDIDGDNRLRPDHPDEAAGLSGHPELVDYDGDEYVDDFDLFLAHYDGNTDHKVVYDAALAAEVGMTGLTAEFADIDNQLSRLIDEANADRDGDGVITDSDRYLGYRDGVLDIKDQYAKVRGRLAFSVAREPWDTANEDSYQAVVLGAVRSGIDVAPVTFEVTDEEMGEITTDMFDDSQDWFHDTATGTFSSQAGTPSTTVWEPVPYGAVEVEGDDFATRGAYDYYERPVYTNKTFTNVYIPQGTNALFENCTFKGVTYVESEIDCDDNNWNLCGAVEKDPDNPGSYPVRFPNHDAEYDNGTVVQSDVGGGTKALSNNLRFNNCTFLGSIAGDKLGFEAHTLTHWRNKLQFTGNTRFYVDADEPELNDTNHPDYQSDAATIVTALNAMNPDDIEELQKSSIFMPGWSIDVGNFTNEQDPDPNLTPTVKLKGTIIAGIFDARGTVDVHGTLLMTFRPEDGEGPLAFGGLVDGFNTTIGYFFRDDGDGEGGDPGDATFTGFGEVTLRYNPNGKLPDGIPWPIRMTADPTTYVE